MDVLLKNLFIKNNFPLKKKLVKKWTQLSEIHYTTFLPLVQVKIQLKIISVWLQFLDKMTFLLTKAWLLTYNANMNVVCEQFGQKYRMERLT